jgi:uncharacterized protein YqgC (DUF456 family)
VDDALLTLLLGLVMLIGLVGVVVPALPGTALVLGAGVAWALLVVDGGAGRWVVVGVMAALLVAGAVLKYVLPGRRLKGSLPRRTMLLAAACAVAGFFLLPPLGLLVGGVVGVYVGEASRLGNRSQARRSTVQVLQAVGVGVLAELTAGVLMVATWLGGLLLV